MKLVTGILLLISVSCYSQSICNKPSKHLIAIADNLKSLGYEADTIRATKVGYKELRKSKPLLIENNIFYNLNPDKTKIVSYNKIDNYLEDQISLNLFKNAKNVWAFFYRNKVKDKNNFIEDGIIEQWEFASIQEALLALDRLNKTRPLPFFNTNPYYVQSANILYIFHTRADAFSYKQKEFFNLFKELLDQN